MEITFWLSNILDFIRAGWRAWANWRKKKILLRIIELRKEAVNIQNTYSRGNLTPGGLAEFIASVLLWKRDFLGEVKKISELKSIQYETLGDADRTPFTHISDPDQCRYLAVIRTYRQSADEFLNEHSKYI